jgi:DNA-binding NtrC family response regulator
LLTDYFLGQFSNQLNCTVTISKDGMQALSQNTWSGNIKELKNTLYQAAILLEAGEQISPALLGLNNQSRSSLQKQHQTLLAMSANGEDALSLTNYFTQFVLDNQDAMSETTLAEKLGISRKSLWQRRNKLGISRKTD